mgnify:FL=1
MDIYVFSIIFAEQMNNKGNISDQKAPLLPVIIGTGFGSGFWPWGPGTAGSVLADIIWVGLAYVVPIAALEAFTVALILLFSVLGVWATAKLMPIWGEDPSRVVVDEMVGLWTALLAAPFFEIENRIWMALAALVLFRFFDIVKPLGIKRLDRKTGAFWVIADDLLGGLYALIVLSIIGNIPGWVI